MESPDIEDRLLKRFTVLKKIEYFIEESVYYRNNKEDLSSLDKFVLWHNGDESGKIAFL